MGLLFFFRHHLADLGNKSLARCLSATTRFPSHYISSPSIKNEMEIIYIIDQLPSRIHYHPLRIPMNSKVCYHLVAIGAEAEPGPDSQRSKGTLQGQGQRKQKKNSTSASFLTISGFLIRKHGTPYSDLHFTSPTCQDSYAQFAKHLNQWLRQQDPWVK